MTMRLRSFNEALYTAQIVNAFNEGVFDSVYDKHEDAHCIKNELYPEIIFQPYNMNYMKPIVFTDEWVYLFTWDDTCNIIRYIEIQEVPNQLYPNFITRKLDLTTTTLSIEMTEELHFQYSLVNDIAELNAFTMYSVLKRYVKDKTKDFFFAFKYYEECLDYLKSIGYIK